MEDLKTLVKENKVFIGAKETLKNIKQGRISKVFLASNCPEETKETVERYAGISEVEVEQLKVPNDELGIMCRKHFFVSVIGLKK